MLLDSAGIDLNSEAVPADLTDGSSIGNLPGSDDYSAGAPIVASTGKGGGAQLSHDFGNYGEVSKHIPLFEDRSSSSLKVATRRRRDHPAGAEETLIRLGENQTMEVQNLVGTDVGQIRVPSCNDCVVLSEGPNFVGRIGGKEKQADIIVEKEVIYAERPRENERNDVDFGEISPDDGFLVSDLVWGKVRSHPWWPGQIFESSAASAMAMKYFRRDRFLIAYFGDHSFAWNEASRLKPFRANFSQMEKQSSLKSFQDAVDCAVGEVSRRVKFGLACSCLPEDEYARIKSQIMVNAGIREESCKRDGGDRFSGVASFQPVKLIKYLKMLARFPCGGFDLMELAIARAQLLAFYGSKGYFQLPDFKMLSELLEDVPDALVSRVKGKLGERSEIPVSVNKHDAQVTSREASLEFKSSSSCEPKPMPASGAYLDKKEHFMVDILAGSCNVRNGFNQLTDEAKSKLISSSFQKKRREINSLLDYSRAKSSKLHKPSPRCKQYSEVGVRIKKAATRLNGSVDEMLLQRKQYSEVGAGIDQAATQMNGSVDEMLLQLYSAACDPFKAQSFLTSTVNYFSAFRDSICSLPNLSGSSLESSNSEVATPGFQGAEDCYWTDRIIERIPEENISHENKSEAGDLMPEFSGGGKMLLSKYEESPGLSRDSGTKRKTLGVEPEMEEVDKTGSHMDEKCKEEQFTAFVLSFTDLNSVPSVINLNRIFSRYGPLEESETKLLKNSNGAKVVFKRRSDAETAFSSTGKYSTFGPSLISYRLKYLSSAPRKTPTRRNKRSRKAVRASDAAEPVPVLPS